MNRLESSQLGVTATSDGIDPFHFSVSHVKNQFFSLKNNGGDETEDIYLFHCYGVTQTERERYKKLDKVSLRSHLGHVWNDSSSIRDS
jgi:hypothetical protein